MFCENCGKKAFRDDAKHCSECGELMGEFFIQPTNSRRATNTASGDEEEISKGGSLIVVKSTIVCAVIFIIGFSSYLFGCSYIPTDSFAGWASCPYRETMLTLNLGKLSSSSIELEPCDACDSVVIDGVTFPTKNHLATSTATIENSLILKIKEDFSLNTQARGSASGFFNKAGDSPESIGLFHEDKRHEQIFIGLDISKSVVGLVKKTNATNSPEVMVGVPYNEEILQQLKDILQTTLLPNTDIFVYHYGPLESNNACNRVLKLHYSSPAYKSEIKYYANTKKIIMKLGDELPSITTHDSLVFSTTSNNKEIIFNEIRKFYDAGLSNTNEDCHDMTIINVLLEKMAVVGFEKTENTFPISGRTYIVSSDGEFGVDSESLWFSPPGSFEKTIDDNFDFAGHEIHGLCGGTTTDKFRLIGVKESGAYLKSLDEFFVKLLPRCDVRIIGYN